jgi:phytanoyl-CoA hydroxylase
MQYEIMSEALQREKSKNKFLTDLQKKYFERDGYLVIRDFISEEICLSLIKEAEKLIENFDSGDVKTIFSTKDQSHAKQQYFLDSGHKIHFFFEEKAFDDAGELKAPKQHSINKMGHALHELNPVFHDFSHYDKISALLHDLDLSDPRITQSMYICKQPHFGGEVDCHQDSTYLYVHGQPIIGLWFALQDATLENGCLWAIPGGHRTALKSRFIRDNNNQVRTEILDHTPWALEKMIPLEVKRGSVIVLHGHLPHLSKENTSNRSRHAYTLHAMSGNDHFAEDNWLRLNENQTFTKL